MNRGRRETRLPSLARILLCLAIVCVTLVSWKVRCLEKPRWRTVVIYQCQGLILYPGYGSEMTQLIMSLISKTNVLEFSFELQLNVFRSGTKIWKLKLPIPTWGFRNCNSPNISNKSCSSNNKHRQPRSYHLNGKYLFRILFVVVDAFHMSKAFYMNSICIIIILFTIQGTNQGQVWTDNTPWIIVDVFIC